MQRHRVTNEEYEKAVFHRDQELACSKIYTRQLRQVKRMMTREVQTTKRVQQVYQRILIFYFTTGRPTRAPGNPIKSRIRRARDAQPLTQQYRLKKKKTTSQASWQVVGTGQCRAPLQDKPQVPTSARQLTEKS